MDQSEDKKNLKRSGKKRPLPQQQQDSNTSNQTSGNFEATSTVGKGSSQNTTSNQQATSTVSGNISSSQNINKLSSGNKGSTADHQKLTESAINGQTSSSLLKVNSEIIEYVNKLEYLVVSTKQKLLRERKAYSQIISSLALFFDSKGIRSQQVEEYVESIVEQLRQNNEQQEAETEQLDWIQFLNDKKSENKQLLQRKQDQMEQQGTNSILTSQDGISGYSNSISANTLTSNNLGSLNSSNLQNYKQPFNGTSSSAQQANNQGNIIRLPISNGDDKKSSQSSQSQVAQKQKNKGTGSNNTPSQQSQSSNKNISSSQNNISTKPPSVVLDDDSEEPKNKKKKKPNPNQNVVDVGGIYGGMVNPQQYAYSNQQLLNFMAQQEQQKLLQNQFLQYNQMAAQKNMSEQLLQQYLLYQQQQNGQ